MHILIRVPGVLSLAALASCKAVYAPNIASTPLLRERGEVRATVDPRNLQLAVAVTSHVGVMANGYHRSEDNEPKPDEEKQHGEGDFVELGVGGFAPLPSLHPWLQLETYAGAGVGTVRHDLTPPGGATRRFEAEGTRVFVMPTLGITRRFWDAAVSTRFVALRYHDLSSRNYTDEQLDADGFAGIDERTWVFVEPSVTLRAGYQWIKLQLQVGKSYKLNSADLHHDSGMITLGLNLDLFRAFD
jgi:hypothetical protein